MPRISIVIPFFRNVDRLEETLVSVLENRPADCEIMVLHAGNYDDPYNLEDEVRFIETTSLAEGLDLAQAIEESLEHARSPILHLLASGCLATAGWTDGVELLFEDPYVGSVVPLVVDQEGKIVSAGIENTAFYETRQLLSSQPLTTRLLQDVVPVGPSEWGGFYRTEALRQVTCLTDFGQSLFALELALALEAIGFETRLEPDSHLRPSVGCGNFGEAIEAEANGAGAESQQAIWRHVGSYSGLQAFLLTAASLTCHAVASVFSAKRRKLLTGQLRAVSDRQVAGPFREFVESAAGPSPERAQVLSIKNQMSLSGIESENGDERSSRTRRAA